MESLTVILGRSSPTMKILFPLSFHAGRRWSPSRISSSFISLARRLIIQWFETNFIGPWREIAYIYIYFIYIRGWKSGNRKREGSSASDDEWWSDGGFACKIKIRVERGRKVLQEEDSEARETGWKIRGCLRFVIYKRPFQEAFSLSLSFSSLRDPSFRPPFPLLFIIIDIGTEG